MTDPVRRLSYVYHHGDKIQGTMHCEILTFEGGTWSPLTIYQQNRRKVEDKDLLSGYVTSTPGQHFRVLLGYNMGDHGRRTDHWHIKHDLLCAIYVDGRRKPVCETTIRRGTFENPVDLTAPSTDESVVFVKGLPFVNIPKEQDQPFSWKIRNDAFHELQKLPRGSECVDDLSSIKLVFSRCKVKKVKQGQSAFPPSAQSETPSKEDRDFEPRRVKHEDLSEYIHIAETEPAEQGFDEIPEFNLESEPFMEFRLYYKSADLLRNLEIMPSNDKSRPSPIYRKDSIRRPPTKSAVPLPFKRAATPFAHPEYRPPTPESQPPISQAKINATAVATPSRPKAAVASSIPAKRKLSDSAILPKPKPPLQPPANTSTSVSKPSSIITGSTPMPIKQRLARNSVSKSTAASPGKKRRIEKTAPSAPIPSLPSPVATPPPASLPPREDSPLSDASSLPSISQRFPRNRNTKAAHPEASTSRVTLEHTQPTTSSESGDSPPRVKQEPGLSIIGKGQDKGRLSIKGKAKGIVQPSNTSFVDLTEDSEDEAASKADIMKKLSASAISTPASSNQPEQASSTATAAIGVPRLVAEREAATLLLTELKINDDSNIQALLDTGFKTREKFIDRLPRMDDEDRKAILGELKADLGKVDYGFLKRNGVEV